MNPLVQLLQSSIGKKYLMALTGFGLAGFVLVHMAGNLNMFLGPEAINAYAHKLQTLPAPVLWGFRAALLLMVVVHVVTAVALAKQNKAARPANYEVNITVQASYASRTMLMSGLIIFAFILFHIAHYTVRVVPGQEFNNHTAYPMVPLLHDGKPVLEGGEVVLVHDVHSMMIHGFGHAWVSAFYIIATGLLCLHLSHGVSSMFQSLGLRNRRWRGLLDKAALAYGVVIFLGFAAIPVAVLGGLLKAAPVAAAVAASH